MALGIRVSDDGMTPLDEKAPALHWATEWKSVREFEELLTERLTGSD